MIRIANLSVVFILGLALVLSSCGEPAEQDDQSLLLGKWVINQALRNGQPTESLDELYFEFYDDGQMNTNLTGEAQSGVYQLEEGVIMQRESGIDADYRIEEINDSLLVLSTMLRDHSFRFQLRRKLQEE